MDNGEQEKFLPSPLVDFSNRYIENAKGKDILQADPNVVGVADWNKLIVMTQNEQGEYGLVVSKRGTKLFQSKIFKSQERNDRISIPLLAQGMKGFLPGTHDITFLHTHSIPEESDRIQTVMISDEDIQGFLNSKFNALLTLDRGGAHLLIRSAYFQKDVPANLASERLKEQEEKKGYMMDAMKNLAQDLKQYDLAYFFCPVYELPKQGQAPFFHNLVSYRG